MENVVYVNCMLQWKMIETDWSDDSTALDRDIAEILKGKYVLGERQ